MTFLLGFFGGVIGAMAYIYLGKFVKDEKTEIHRITKKKGRKPKIVSHSEEDLYKKEVEENR